MAAPHVSGASALLKALKPSLTHLEIKNILMKSVDPIPSLYGMTVTGGRLNIQNAITFTYTVHNINNGINYTTIQAAIDNASPGDEIHVGSGTYYENVNVSKQLTLRGIGMPVVDAGGNGSAITLSADGITLEGFTTTQGYIGIKVVSNNNTLSSNNANSNYVYGISLSSSSNNTLISNNANWNAIIGYGIGISLSSSNNNTLIDNIANSKICHADVDTCIGGTGILLTSSSNNTLIGNNADNNSDSIVLSDSSNNTLISNTANGNLVYYSPNECFGTGISLYSSINNKLIGNNANSNCVYGIFLVSSGDNMLNSNNAN